MSNEEQAIVPQAERVVEFYGDEIPVAQVGEEIYVPLRPLSTFLGLNVSGQRQRVQRDPIIAKRLQQVLMRGADGKQYEQLCLPLDLLPGWLFGITTGKMSAAMGEKLNRYREECFRVLWRAFRDDILPATAAPAINLTPAEQILQQTEALYKLAQQQVEYERRFKTMADYMRGFVKDTRQQIGQHEQRLSALELCFDPAHIITEEQAAQLTLAVRNVAYAMGGTGSDYGKVYGELYRRFSITTYHNLPSHRFDEAMTWLEQRFADLEKQKQ